MKITTLKSILAFTFSPFFIGGPILSFVFSFAPKSGPASPLIISIVSFLGLCFLGFIFFFIPATIVGVIYSKNTHLSNFKQESVCSLSGFVICVLYLSPTIATKGYELVLLFGIIGAITAFIVARLLNYLKNKGKKLP